MPSLAPLGDFTDSLSECVASEYGGEFKVEFCVDFANVYVGFAKVGDDVYPGVEGIGWVARYVRWVAD
jgi:hypothetical protein